jgi:hypothetical protein
MKQANIERQVGQINTRIQDLTADSLMTSEVKEDIVNRNRQTKFHNKIDIRR